jgi:enediyne biosynthesis protein E4
LARTQTQEVRGGGSYYAQNDLRAHFGLGDATRVDRLDVRWPTGLEETWTGVPVNRIVTLEEGTGKPAASR